MHKIVKVLLLLLSVILFSSCDDQPATNAGSTGSTHTNTQTTVKTSPSPPTEKPPKNTWKTLITSHTTGTIPRDSSVHIRFNNSIIEEDKKGTNAKSNFTITPSIAGKAVYETANEIIFIPDQSFQSGTSYAVTLQPNGFKGLSSTASPYQFEFSIIPLEYEIEIGTLQSDPDNSTMMLLDGIALFSDHVSTDQVSKIVTAKQQEQPLKISWKSDESNKSYRFTIHGLKRESYATDVTINWTGKPLDLKTSGQREVSIPAINEFKVVSISRITPESDQPYIQITLSDNHNDTQSLKGLIRLEPIPDSKRPTPKPVPFTLNVEGNIIKLFPKDGTIGQFNVAVEAGLKNEKGKTLGAKTNQTIELETLKPGIRFVGKGHILPDNDTLEIPFEAANVKAVQVTAFIVNPDNMAQFLQTNTLAGDDELGRVGRHLWRKTIQLSAPNSAQWNRYTLDASELLKSYPGGLFHLELTIDRRHSTFKCPANTEKTHATSGPLTDHEDLNVTENSGWDGIEQYGFIQNSVQSQNEAQTQDRGYEWFWKNRNNPCSDAYYKNDDNKVQASRNFIASNIGLLAKQDAHGELLIIATDLKTSQPLQHVTLEIQNFQHQPLAVVKTDSEGFAKVKLKATPFLLIATHENEKAYLKLNGSTALSVSHFDVGGDTVKEGLKGIIYGERGVWRPGDDIHLTFVLQDKDNIIPENHPVSMQLINPKGRVVQNLTNTTPTGDFYEFQLKTDDDAETGKWLVTAKLGGSTFSKTITIETIRPNRLKIDLDFGTSPDSTEPLYGYEPLPEGKLFSQWLHGASAGGLKTDISVRFREKTTKFSRFTDYVFDDPARSLDSDDQKILEGRLDDNGILVFTKQFKPKSKSAGMLSAWFTTRVFEEGGAFSTSKQFIDYHPYSDYVGIKLPKGDATRSMLLTDKQHTVQIASLNAKGESSELERIQVTLYKIDWKWWWDKSSESLAAFTNAHHKRKLQQGIVKTLDGRAKWNFEIKYPDWGRYLVRACDLNGKHCTGKTVYIDWPGWAGRAQEQGNSAASTLSLYSDKKAYTVDDTAIIQLPSASQGRALVTVESGSDILSQQWVEFDETRQQVEIPITEQMAPNVYVNVTLLQPHQNKANDRPIRLLGIIPLAVTDPTTHLKPVLTADEEWKPLSTQTVEIKEANGQAMDYTLAMVDEGLLGLTRFKTPDLHSYFYRKEALGIKSWDLFDDVVGAYGGKLERLLALGGGDDVQIDDAANKPKRFPPVIQFLGPFHLQKGETKEHKLTLPAYIGAVRVMVVAGNQGAYGSTDQSIFVRQPLIMQPSLPRVISVNEEVIIPVTLFSTKDSIKDVELSISTDTLVEVVNEKQTTVHFEKTGDKLGFLRIKAGNVPGQTHLRFAAKSGEYSTLSDVYLDIRRPNSPSNRVTTTIIEAGKTEALSISTHGIEGTNSATLEISASPPLGLEKHLDYLVQYPHGCLEQATSSAFPQLYLSKLLDIGGQREKKITAHVSRAIDKMRSFQNLEGDFTYWPSGNARNKWSSLYAGHFLIEAKNMGYQIPPSMLANWLRYQRGAAQRWLVGSKDYDYVQAYRLYVLALAGKPELGAMNRFRENQVGGYKDKKDKGYKKSLKAKWLLAAAYQLAGQNDAAKSVVEGVVADPSASTVKHSNTFSTRLSDLGLQLNALSTLGRTQDADRFIQAIADELTKSSHNTHGIAWALMAVSHHLIGVEGAGISVEYTKDTPGSGSTNSPFEKLQSKKAYLSQTLGEVAGGSLNLKLKNTATTKLFASVISKGIPAAGTESEVGSGLDLNIDYKRVGSHQPLDFSEPIPQGKDIYISTRIYNESDKVTENFVLSHIIPTGWEIHNVNYGVNDKFDYQEVRDDRIYTYFSLESGKTKHFSMLVNPAYTGNYYLPAVTVEAMYDPTIHARKKGRWIDVQATNNTNSSSK